MVSLKEKGGKKMTEMNKEYGGFREPGFEYHMEMSIYGSSDPNPGTLEMKDMDLKTYESVKEACYMGT